MPTAAERLLDAIDRQIEVNREVEAARQALWAETDPSNRKSQSAATSTRKPQRKQSRGSSSPRLHVVGADD